MQKLIHISCLALFVGVAACEEDLTAPGACPAFCPPAGLDVFDSVISGSIASDTLFRGYVQPWRAAAMPVAAGGGTVVSYGFVRFVEFIDSLRPTGGGDLRPVVAVDSFRLRIFVRRWSRTAGLSLGVHRLPVTLDTTTQLGDIEAFFADSTLVGTIDLPQDTIPGDTLAVILPPDAFPEFRGDDSLKIAVGFALRASQPAFADVRTAEAGTPVSITRFAKIELAGTTDTSDVSDARSALVDSYVFTGVPAPSTGALLAGGVPSARSFLRLQLPSRIVDSSNVLRATLILVPTEPVAGAPGDTLLVRAEQMPADFGAKSPFVPLPDSIGGRRVQVGSTDSVRIDITHIVRAFRQDSLLPRSVMIRLGREGGTFGEFRFHRGSDPQFAPAVQLTWAPSAGAGGS